MTYLRDHIRRPYRSYDRKRSCRSSASYSWTWHILSVRSLYI